MALAGKPEGGNRTPNRTRDRTQQFFEPGKVGRKTGITLKDTGIRDEYGLEPVSGIFSSPPTNPPSRTLGSSDMRVQDSDQFEETLRDTRTPLPLDSGSRIEARGVLRSTRRTPRLPPPRSATPKHTNIGSPKRMSSAYQRRTLDDHSKELESPRRGLDALPPNRKLDFGAHRNSASPSPFKPKKTLRRSTLAVRPDPFALPAEVSEADIEPVEPSRADESLTAYDAVDGQDSYAPLPEFDDEAFQQDAGADDEGVSLVDQSPSGLARTDPPSRRATMTQVEAVTPGTNHSSGRKRNSTVLDNDDEDISISIETEDVTRPIKRSRQSSGQSLLRHEEGLSRLDDAEQHQTIDPSMLGTQDQPLAIDDAEETSGAGVEDEVEAELEVEAEPAPMSEPELKAQRQKKSKKDKTTGQPTKPKKRVRSPTGSPSKARATSTGPVSNVHLRSTTPFEDAEGRRSRYGRTLTQPLKYWANETRIWKEGEIEGIVRADEVVKPGTVNKKKGKKQRRGLGSKLEDIEEEDVVNDSVLPDDWEEELGVISGMVARYDPDTETGDQEEPVREDLAFAASSIVTRDVLDGDFKYAKIITMPFFGCGVVELPPYGYKKVKSSKKMQMVFFVHDGKVLVEVGQKGMEINQFNISKGGVWVVPRGNFYAISNESRTTTARIFFAQGCETEARTKADKTGL